MKVELVNYTEDALDLLLVTKNTRLRFDSDPSTWDPEIKEEHLSYMRDTIKSSWEFIDYTFKISGVSRAFTHQLVRTRTGSYAQESQRVSDLSEAEWVTPPLSTPRAEALFRANCASAFDGYAELIGEGVPLGDARAILPTATATSIMAKFNLRTLHDMAKVRLCTRTQGEYQRVFREMRKAVVRVHPWIARFQFLEVHCVSEGTCCFPRYGKKECPVYDVSMDLSALKERTREKYWMMDLYEAKPIAKDGKAS